MTLIQVGENVSKNCRTGEVTTTPILRELEEVRAERKAALRDEVWSEVQSHIDQREQLALLSVAVTACLKVLWSSLPPEAQAQLAPILAASAAIEERLAAWPEVEAAIEAADTLVAIEEVRVPPATRAIPRVRATDIVRGGDRHRAGR